MSDMVSMIEPHIPALRRFASGLLGNGDKADDLVQDCLERAVRGWRYRRRDGNVKSWLFTILHNCFLNDRRRDGRRGVPASLADAPEMSSRPHQDMHMEVLDVLDALDALPDEQRAVLLLIGVEEMSYEDAARSLGVPIGTIMSRLSRGRERLRQVMAGERPNGRPALRSVK